MKTVGVYCILTPSGSAYVGMTLISFETRWRCHVKGLIAERHICPGLRHAFAKHGVEGLTFTKLETWELTSRELLMDSVLKAERRWWLTLESEGHQMLHGCPTGTGSVIHTMESRQKVSRSLSNRYWERLCRNCNKNFSSLSSGDMHCAECKLVLRPWSNCDACGLRFQHHSYRKYCFTCRPYSLYGRIELDNGELTKLYSEGLTIQELCAHFAVKKSFIYGRIKALGLTR